MNTIALFVALLVLSGSPVLAETEDHFRVIAKIQVTTQNAVRNHTMIFALEPGTEKNTGSAHPRIEIRILPRDGESVPLVISLLDEIGAELARTAVSYTPESGARFSLNSECIAVTGEISTFKRMPDNARTQPTTGDHSNLAGGSVLSRRVLAACSMNNT